MSKEKFDKTFSDFIKAKKIFYLTPIFENDLFSKIPAFIFFQFKMEMENEIEEKRSRDCDPKEETIIVMDGGEAGIAIWKGRRSQKCLKDLQASLLLHIGFDLDQERSCLGSLKPTLRSLGNL
jgi:hypothetical protein